MPRSAFRPALLLSLVCLLAATVVGPQRPEQGPKPVATGESAMVSSSHPDVTRAMLDVLRDGGNAVDAMLTAVPLQHVIEPQMSTLAGGMGGLIYWAQTGELVYLDAELDHTAIDPPAGEPYGTPGGVPITSGRRIGVPGTVRGLEAAAERFGTREWGEYFGPAIDAAEGGFAMYSFLYAEMSDAQERLAAHPASRDKWLGDGFVPAVGDVVRQPRLAETLRRLAADGADHFYTGAWARRFVDEVERTGGTLSREDLEAYEVRWVDPVRFSFRGHRLAGAPPASTAGILNAMILSILEPFDLAAMGHYTESAETLALLRTAYDLAQVHVSRFVADPRTAPVPVEQLVAPEYGARLAALIEATRPRAAPADPEEASAAPGAASPGASPPPRHDQPAGVPRTAGAGVAGSVDPGLYLDTDTNHLTIVDTDGNWVSMTHTVYGSTFGTGLTVDGVGVNSGNTFPGTGQGDGRRVITPFPALMVLDDDGEPWLALGSPGLSSRAVALVVINHLGFGMELYDAVEAPRFRGFAPGQALQIEGRVPDAVLDRLPSHGVRVSTTAPYNWHMGSIQAVSRDPGSGRLIGVADPRRAGHAAGY